MKITETKVKTICTIEFGCCEFTQAVSHYMNSMEKHKYPRAFENVDLHDEIKISVIDNFFRNMGIEGNGDLYLYLANYFGFDGWENAGYYTTGKNCYRMVVFNYGDTLNA